MKKETIAVLMGGISAEREISLLSGKEVVNELKKSNRYRVLVYDPKNDLQKLIQDKDQIDVVMPILHGPFGEDGIIQGFLELLNVPYAFSGVLSSALAMDKQMSREIFKHSGLLIPRGMSVNKESFDLKKVESDLKLPCIVKPNANGSSVGTNIVHQSSEWKKAIEKASKVDHNILIEEFIKGTELTVTSIGNLYPKSLPVIKIVPPGEFFSRDVKYTGETKELVPAPIPKELTKKAQEIGIIAHRALGCRGLSRTDMILKDNKLYVIELNTIPGMTPESLAPKAAKAAGMTFLAFLEELIRLAKEGKDVSPKI